MQCGARPRTSTKRAVRRIETRKPLSAGAPGGTFGRDLRGETKAVHDCEPEIEAILASISDGCRLALPKAEAGAASAAIRGLIRRGARNLSLWCLPSGGYLADLLIGAGCVARIECSGVSLGEHGAAPRFRRAVEQGRLEMRDATCQAMYAAVQAGEKGMPFVSLRGIIGSDLLVHRDDWKVMQNPFADEEDPVVVLPAFRPDVALFHARLGDPYGNLWVGNSREAIVLAHAARTTVATYEARYDGNLMEDERYLAGTIAPLYIEAAAHLPNGAWPLGLAGAYEADRAHLAEYAAAARTEDGFARYLREHIAGGARAV